jgi:TRAP-type mannitol/chloroaromatic compound transport system permease large subunit
MLASLYVGYLILLAWWKPALMPPLTPEERYVPLPGFAQRLAQHGRNALTVLSRAATGDSAGVARRTVLAQLFVTLVPLLFVAGILAFTYRAATEPQIEESTAGIQAAGFASETQSEEPEMVGGAPVAGEPEAQGTAPAAAEANKAEQAAEPPAAPAAQKERLPTPWWFWLTLGIAVVLLSIVYRFWNWERLEVFKLLLASFFPLALLILAVLGSIVFGLSTPSEAAAVGAFGGFILAAIYRFIAHWRAQAQGRVDAGAVTWSTVKELGTIIKESSFLTAKTSAMVCWLFVGSGIFSASFALLGGQEVVEKWVLSLDMTPVQFMILAQFIIFILGWPLEWTEIIIIFMPIFLPLLPHFHIDPLFFGLLVALNLQTAFLSPPVAMAAFYLKGVSPPHVTLNAIFAGMMPFMGIQIIALILLYVFPQIGLWLPSVVYGR